MKLSKPVIFTIVAVVFFIIVTFVVVKKSSAAESDLEKNAGSDNGSSSASNSSEFPYPYVNSGVKYSFASSGVKKLQERILSVYSTYHGNSTYPLLYDAAVAMKNAGGADGKLGAKTKAAFDACNFPSLLANSSLTYETDYVKA